MSRNIFLSGVLIVLGIAAGIRCAGADDSTELAGSWVGRDGRVVTFERNGNSYIGRYTQLGTLGLYHFRIGEVGYKATKTGVGQYSGEVKWRWTDGRSEWRSNRITIRDGVYTDTGSDSNSNRMVRKKSKAPGTVEKTCVTKRYEMRNLEKRIEFLKSELVMEEKRLTDPNGFWRKVISDLKKTYKSGKFSKSEYTSMLEIYKHHLQLFEDSIRKTISEISAKINILFTQLDKTIVFIKKNCEGKGFD